jgi:PGF-pre-PGF domain-containing protein
VRSDTKFAILALLIFFVAGMLVAPATAATTEVTVTKLASDDKTVLDQKTVTWQWMKDNLPVLGDGEMVYYTQGPVFEDAWTEVHPGEPYDGWNPTEDVNLVYKDHGEFMGTDVKDLCNLVGGADPDDIVEIKAYDGLSKKWPAKYIYTPNPRQGPMVIAWYHGKDTGYVNESFREGMRLYFFGETTNEQGMHVWGNWDMHESWDEKYWYYYNNQYPSASGNSVQVVNKITIHSSEPITADWSISLNGSTDRTLARGEFLTLAAAHPASFQHTKYGLLEGTNLSAVIGLVDDNDPTTVNATLAAKNYTITVYGKKKGVDYTSTFYSTEVTDGKKTYVLGNTFNGIEINQSTYIDRVFFPLYLQGTGVDTTQRAVEQISKIELDLPAPGADVIFEGPASLGDGNVTVTASSGADYSIKSLTPLGALETVAKAEGFTYKVTDKKWIDSGILMLDDIGSYPFIKSQKSWSCYVNGVVLDDYGNPSTDGLNKRVLVNGDRVNFYYGLKGGTTPENAEAAVLITARLTNADIIYSGEVTLGAGNVTVTASSGADYSITSLTPLGALETVAKTESFTYKVTDKKWIDSGILMLDDIGSYPFIKNQKSWSCYVNDVVLDDYGNPSTDGLNKRVLVNGDRVNFYYGLKGGTTPENAEAAVFITVKVASAPGDWTLSLKGKTTQTFTKVDFEQSISCQSSHKATWTDPATGDVWAGMPLWMLVAMVDDEETGGHYTFNDALATKGYSVKVTSKDGYSINIPSSEMARSSGFIVANTLNGSALPETIGEKNKPCWPLQIKGSEADAGQLVGAIASIELVGLPEPDQGWTLRVCGAINDTITQAEFEEAGCHGGVEYTDGKGRVWSGVPLWFLVGVSDNIETADHWTYDDTLAATNYTVKIVSGDGTTISFGSRQINRSSDYILADRLNGTPIADADSSYPLRIVGDSVGTGLKNVVEIDLVDLIPGPAPDGSWNLDLKGKIDYTATEEFFEQAVACSHHTATWTNPETGERWSGLPLWDLCGWVDDRISHGSNGFNDGAATAGYTVIVTAGDGYSKEFSSKDIARNNGYIIANTLNGTALPKDGSKAPWPLRLVGPAVSGSNSVGSIAKIELTEFQKPTEIPDLHIIKYGADGTTIIAETTLNYTSMEKTLTVYGDGETVYRFQGPTFDPADLWNPEENKNVDPGKVYGAVKGTSLKDLCDLVGGMEPGTEITLEAVDGYQTKMNYTNVYAPLDRQGTAVLAWYKKDEGYVPDYGNGYRLYFITSDTIFGNDDMRASFAPQYHHFYFDSGIQYPSAGGLSARNIATIKIYQTEKDWTLSLEGTISTSMSKHYFEEGIACEASHRAEYTDSKGRVWQGMPLWRVIGWVDDDNEHTGRAFNDAMAAEGYTIHIVASDGSETTIDSRNLSRYDDTNYILANSLDDRHIQPADKSWPLRLVGDAIGTSTKGVVRIAFIPPGMDDAVQDIGTIPAGSEKNFTVKNCTFSNLTLKAKSDITGGEFAISAVNTLPQSVDTPGCSVFQYVHVLYPQSQDSLGEAGITFSVPLSWLSAQGIAAKDVRLMRYHDGVWQQLPTTYLESRGGSAYFTATTPGFSYFAVGGTKPAPVPLSYSSSSGGGSSAISAVSGSIPAGESKTFSVTETAFSTITVRASDAISSLLLTVQAAAIPKGAPAPEGTVYEIQEVTLYKTDPSAIEGVTIEFTVDAAWLKAHGVSAGDVTLLRYVNGEWTRLETTFVEEKEGKAYYSAGSPGFSFFAITAEKSAAVTPEVQAPQGEVTTPAVTETTAATTAATTPQKSPVFWALPFIALCALLLLWRR